MIQAGLDYSRNWDAESLYRPVPQVQKVRRTYRKSNPKGKMVVKIGAAVFLYALVLVFLCIKGSTLGYQIVQLEKDIHQLETANHRMDYTIAARSSLDHIEIAAAQLGLQKPEQGIAVAVAPSAEPVTVEQNAGQNANTHVGEGLLNKLYNNLVVLAQNNL